MCHFFCPVSLKKTAILWPWWDDSCLFASCVSWLVIRQSPASWSGRDVENHVGLWAEWLSSDCASGPLPGHAVVPGRWPPKGEINTKVQCDTVTHFPPLTPSVDRLRMGLSLIGKARVMRFALAGGDVTVSTPPPWFLLSPWYRWVLFTRLHGTSLNAGRMSRAVAC